MSYISILDGEIHYDNDEAFETAVESLETKGFADDLDIDETAMTITIPYGTYRNLGRHLGSLMRDASGGKVVGVSNDVSWHATIDSPNRGDDIDITDWADQHGFEDPPDADADWDAYVEWQSQVEAEFMDEHAV